VTFGDHEIPPIHPIYHTRIEVDDTVPEPCHLQILKAAASAREPVTHQLT